MKTPKCLASLASNQWLAPVWIECKKAPYRNSYHKAGQNTSWHFPEHRFLKNFCSFYTTTSENISEKTPIGIPLNEHK
jgi:hypothetical protein